MEQKYENDIAIIGMAGRFPKAKNIEAYWQNLVKGLNSISQATEEQLANSGLPNDILKHDRFVNASSKLEDARYFDANFFGLSNTEATLMDPQIRLLLQTSWHALEDAGYALNELDIPVGNFCGMSTNSYLMKILRTNATNEVVDPLLYRILNEKDFLATWISYKLNLTGPAMTVQTACSTSLLAIHLACQSLLNLECTLALAGGVSFDSEDGVGYMHVPESIYSKDGLCRPFDKDASGTIMGDGVGAIILKRAEEAIADNDHIYALIKGTAANNDGANKQGYTTPSVSCQRDVVIEAIGVSDIEPDTIGMIEAHGTGTLIGDPIEVAALTEAFQMYTDKKQFCAIGSVKSNIGHLDAAAGVASTIKAALCVNKGFLVPSLNFSTPNPSLDLEQSPFYVSQENSPWLDNFELRRAGVSSLGVGGTNVHIIVEQPPETEPSSPDQGAYVFTLSAMNDKSLDLQKKELAAFIETNPDILLQDLEFTSLYGRKVMPVRFSVVCESREELIAQLSGSQLEKCYEGRGDLGETVFLFPGQGSQYTNMAIDLYNEIAAFKTDMDYCFDHVQSLSGIDFKAMVFSDDSTLLNQTENTQISLFIIEYCLAKELLRIGIKPDVLIGHSLGEYVAACIVGCITLEDALKLVYHRGRLMGAMPEGDMVLVRMNEEELKPLLLDTVSVCAYNAADNIVIGGTKEAIQKQIALFDANQTQYKKLKVSHAYHTSMMQGVLEDYEQVLSEVSFQTYEAKVFSTYTGTLVTPEIFCSKQYWLDQIMHPVKFLDAAQEVTNYLSNPVFIEVGPGSGLSSFISSIFKQEVSAVNLVPKASDKSNGLNKFQEAKALLCAKGVVYKLPESHTGKRVSFPGYMFAKNYFWKPKTNIYYQDFKQINDSYHYSNERYLSDRLRSFVEIQMPDKASISEELLDRLNSLHQQYIEDLKKILPPNEGAIQNGIEVMYDDVSFNQHEDATSESNDFNKQRKVNSIFVEPSTEMEKTIAEFWGDILGYQPVGVLDNYFEVGGNSLLATQLINKIVKSLEIELTISEVLSSNTVKDLALLVDEKKWLKIGADVEVSDEMII